MATLLKRCGKTTDMFYDMVTQPGQALLHLFFHCCLKDEELQEAELQTITEIIVAEKLNQELDIKKEAASYRSYYHSIKDETAYLSYLIRLIRPQNKLALFSFCIELFMSDKRISFSEEILSNKLAGLLHITEAENHTIQKLIMELNQVRTMKHF